ncbi:efflux RND transporter periplasmic adaptor subunit [Bradyrhizobium frederickii]|uniref:Efflux RND transporter periplasmic adaptor subunit n=1 Tax=Bradyrhizobium frederickii TaxID=2560054 RepID=A0A4Y9L9B4_9BRAD|nr:efflux RND transporter periplasmic adaptor subunit [Bradyrhizobium frederickii]TFV39499.1 efflux RND transporter periplasmic adaptor subunit [Bradyrhizobium frederickii]
MVSPIAEIVRRAQRMSCILLCLYVPAGILLARSGARAETLEISAEKREFNCVIEPQQTVKLASPAVGMIARLDVDRGDIVRQGQIIGKIEDGVEAATLALARARATNDAPVKSAEARAQFLHQKHERLRELHTRSVSPLASLQEVEAEVRVAEQQLKEAKLHKELARLEVAHAEEVLNQRALRSPIDGVVVERLLVPGEYRNDQSPVFTLAQIDPLRVEVFVPTAYFGQIRTGSRANVRPELPIAGLYAASVTVVDRVLDAASGTFGVRLALPNPRLALPGGIRCKVEFVLDGDNPALMAGDAPSSFENSKTYNQ